jgi:NAD(P)-dependent dehydrogenase (short-subunit alcohol dehydrogenase family)
MNFQLEDKVALVTGASRGIGRAIALALAGEGMRVALVARSREAMEQLVDGALVHAADLHEPDAPQRAVDATVERFGRLDLLVNNAGATVRGDFLELTDDQWQDGFALKFYGAMRCSRAAWPHLMKTNGVIVNIAGVGGRTGSAEFAIGGAVNAALMNLTKVLADRGIRDGVRVNAINPGGVRTERLETRIAAVAREQQVTAEEAAARMAQKLGTAAFGAPEDIARTVAFIASNHYLQGSIIDVDGGQTRTM